MAISVNVSTTGSTIAVVKPAQKYYADVTVKPSANISLGDLTNVDVSGAENNEVLVFDQANNAFVVAPYVVDANTNITNINGGLF